MEREETEMRGTLTRRNFLRASGGALVGAYALGLAGCGGGGGGGGSAKTLEFWFFDEGRASFAKAAYESEMFKSAQPDVKVNFRIFPFDQMHNKLLSALVSGKGAPDIADIEIGEFGKFIKGERIPLIGLKDRIGGEIDNVFKPAALDPWSWQDEIYTGHLPRRTEAIQYNPNLEYKQKLPALPRADADNPWPPPQYQASFKA